MKLDGMLNLANMEKVVWGYFQGKQSLFKCKDHHYKPSYTKSLKKNTIRKL